MPWPQRHEVRLQLFPLVLTGLASQHLGERIYGLFAGPHDLGQINQAFMAAPPATDFEQFAAAGIASAILGDGSAGPPMNWRTLHSWQVTACAAR